MDEQNPYQVPAAGLNAGAIEYPGARLFKVSGIGLATFLGTLLAGGLLLALNFRALGQPDKARNALLYSLAGFVAVIVAVFVLPDSIPSVAFTLPQVIAMVQVAKQYQEPQINERKLRGVGMRSNWLAAGISLLVFVVVLVLFVAGFVGLEMLGFIQE